jgi:hypothetical protein
VTDEGVCAVNPISTSLGALRVAATTGPGLVRTPPASEVTRALDVAGRVMAAANDRMTVALAAQDLAGFERASMSYDAAERRFDELCAAASEAGYGMGSAAVPDKPVKVGRFTRRERWTRRLAARLRNPLGAAAAH